MLFMSCVCHASASVHRCLGSPAGKGLNSWLLFVMSYCNFVIFPCGILGQVWYLIVLIPCLCHLSNLAPIFPNKMFPSLWSKRIFLKLTGKIRRGVTERVDFITIFTSCEYIIIQRRNIIKLSYAHQNLLCECTFT